MGPLGTKDKTLKVGNYLQDFLAAITEMARLLKQNVKKIYLQVYTAI